MKLVTLAADVTTVNNGAAVALNKTPLLGGQFREGLVRIPVLPLTSTVLIQGAAAVISTDGNGKAPPDAGSADWATLLTITSTSDQNQRLTDLPDYVRYRTSVLDADGPVVDITIEGEQ